MFTVPGTIQYAMVWYNNGGWETIVGIHFQRKKQPKLKKLKQSQKKSISLKYRIYLYFYKHKCVKLVLQSMEYLLKGIQNIMMLLLSCLQAEAI